MTIVLIGPPAAGKSRVGKKLAKRLGVEFIDTDQLVIADYGPISEIFATHGEAHFRQLERSAVVRALTTTGIVSVGGGAVLDPQTQADLDNHTVILLTTSADAVASRIENGKRPLVSDVESWKQLMAGRAELYASLADYTVDTSARALDTIVEELANWVEEPR